LSGSRTFGSAWGKKFLVKQGIFLRASWKTELETEIVRKAITNAEVGIWKTWTVNSKGSLYKFSPLCTINICDFFVGNNDCKFDYCNIKNIKLFLVNVKCNVIDVTTWKIKRWWKKSPIQCPFIRWLQKHS